MHRILTFKFMFCLSLCHSSNFNQESNNKLIECKKCTKLYHQQCHTPQLGSIDIETSSPVSSQHESNNLEIKQWVLPECSACKSVSSTSTPVTNASANNVYPFDEECTRMPANTVDASENKPSTNLNTNNKTSSNNPAILIEMGASVLPEIADTPLANSSTNTTNTTTATNANTSLNNSSAKFFKREISKVMLVLSKLTGPFFEIKRKGPFIRAWHLVFIL